MSFDFIRIGLKEMVKSGTKKVYRRIHLVKESFLKQHDVILQGLSIHPGVDIEKFRYKGIRHNEVRRKFTLIQKINHCLCS